MKSWIAGSVLVCGLTGVVAHAAESYPQRPIRLIMSNAPGSTTDVLGRIIFVPMGETLGQNIVVDNRAGAGGVIGTEIGARQAPDGYNFVTVTISHVTTPHLVKNLPYHPIDSFEPVSYYVKSNVVVLVNAGVAAKSIKEFVELAKAKPGQFNMSSAGQGSTSHLSGSYFAQVAGIKVTHIPYKGGGPSMAAVATGEAQWTAGPISAGMAHVRAGRMRMLAIGSAKRSPLMPDLPTVSEAGVPGFEFFGWNGILAPKGTPQRYIHRIQQAMVEALQRADTVKAYSAQGEEPAWLSPEEFGRFMREQLKKMAEIVRIAGVQPI